jgi:hypothetical protein
MKSEDSIRAGYSFDYTNAALKATLSAKTRALRAAACLQVAFNDECFFALVH